MGTKKCKKCRKTKPLNQFGKRRRNNKQYRCNVCTLCKQKTTYTVAKKIRLRNRKYILDEKKNSKCVYCGEPDYRVLQFHHVKDKKYKISFLSSSTFSLKKIKEELDKCIVLCANCHIKEHYENPR